MSIILECKDYGFECSFKLDEEPSLSLIEELRNHFESEHNIDYPIDAVIQMVTNKGHSLESIKKN